MRAFLSHSSKDKGFVEAVAAQLRPGTYELDAETFDRGLINSQAIVSSLNRSNVFCLFLSKHSVRSSYVQFERLLGVEFIASGRLSAFLPICLDDSAFSEATTQERLFNVVRLSPTPEGAARLIQGALVANAANGVLSSRPFVGREEELKELETQLFDSSRPNAKALFIAGNAGSGRRALSRKFYRDFYPQVGKIFPEVAVSEFSGLDDLYRHFLAELKPSLRAQQLRIYIQAFEAADVSQQRRLLADLVNRLLADREATFILDRGGVLSANGALAPEINEVLSLFEDSPHPPAIFVSPRMIPRKLRRPQRDVAHLSVSSLSYDDSGRLLKRLLKDKSVEIEKPELDSLIKISDGHPFNIYQLVDEVSEVGISVFLSNPSNFIEWKHKQSSDYISKIDISDIQKKVVSVLNDIPELDFDSLVIAISEDPSLVSDAIYGLMMLHVLESRDDRFSIAPPLRVATERDKRFRMTGDAQRAAMKAIADRLNFRLDEGSAPISLIDAAVYSALKSGDVLPAVSAAFLLPSHRVWLAKQHYDNRRWEESVRFAEEALTDTKRLSMQGYVAACRYICLSSARLGHREVFESGIRRLEKAAGDDWSRSNVEFLKGFNYRLQGRLPLAEEHLRAAYNLLPGNVSAARELASICLMRESLPDAEMYAREAYEYARSNPYILDILLSILISKYGARAHSDPEVLEMLDRLKWLDENDDRSFYLTRMAEIKLLEGNYVDAADLISQAISKTPHLFGPQKIFAEVCIRSGDLGRAYDVIQKMKDIVHANDRLDRRTNYRSYLQTLAEYYVESRRYPEAKKIFADQTIFSDAEQQEANRQIEIAMSFTRGG